LTDATAYSNANFGQNTNIIIALDDIACTTAQSRLIDCTYDSHTADCSHSEDAGVACVARKFPSLYGLIIVEDIVVCNDIHPLYLKGVHMVTSD